MPFCLEGNGHGALVLTLNERKARQAVSSPWNLRETAGREERGALRLAEGVTPTLSHVGTASGTPASPRPLPPAALGFSPVYTLLVQPLSKLQIHWPKRNKKLLHEKMKVLWQCFPLSLGEHSKQRSLFFLT